MAARVVANPKPNTYAVRRFQARRKERLRWLKVEVRLASIIRAFWESK